MPLYPSSKGSSTCLGYELCRLWTWHENAFTQPLPFQKLQFVSASNKYLWRDRLGFIDTQESWEFSLAKKLRFLHWIWKMSCRQRSKSRFNCLSMSVWAKKLLGPKETQIWLYGLLTHYLFLPASQKMVSTWCSVLHRATQFENYSKSLIWQDNRVKIIKVLIFEVWFQIKKLTLID